ncbi:MAG: hypothetical protein ABI091_26855 [Ferruginibacter sp.]
MAICKGGLSVVRNLVKHITTILEDIVTEITVITGKIKDLEASPAVESIIAIIPGGSVAEAWFNAAIDELTGIANEGKTLAEKIQSWLDTLPTASAKNAGVFKLASLATKAADTVPDSTKTESFYDSAVQLHIMSEKDS